MRNDDGDNKGSMTAERGAGAKVRCALAEAMVPEALRSLRDEVRAFKFRLAALRKVFGAARKADAIITPPGWLEVLRKEVESVQSGFAALAKELAEIPETRFGFELPQSIKDLRKSMDVGPTFMESLRKKFGLPSSLSGHFQSVVPNMRPGFFDELSASETSPNKSEELEGGPRPAPEETPKVRPGKSEQAQPATLADATKKLQAAGEKFSASLKGVDVRLGPLHTDLKVGVISPEVADDIRHSLQNFGVKLKPGFEKVSHGLADFGDMLQEAFGSRKLVVNLPFLPARIVRSENKE